MTAVRRTAPPWRGEALERRVRVTQWMLRAARPTPTPTPEGWAERGVAPLTAGIVWDAVRAPYSALGDGFTAWEELRSTVKALGVGAVWCDPLPPAIYFLVPPGTSAYWPRDSGLVGVVCQGGTPPFTQCIVVPSLDRTSPPGHYWLIPPDYGGPVLADPEHLYEALCARAAEAASCAPTTR